MENKGNKGMDAVERLMKVMVSPIVWDKRMKNIVVSGIEKSLGDKLTDKEIRVVKAAWCHGFTADPKEVMGKTLENLKKEDGENEND
jgi:hypothetical protein